MTSYDVETRTKSRNRSICGTILARFWHDLTNRREGVLNAVVIYTMYLTFKACKCS